MRATFGRILVGLGGFLLLAGLIAAIWAPGKAERTPLDVDTTTRLAGQAARLDAASGDLESNPVKAVSITKSDSEASDDDVGVFTRTGCLVVDEGDVPDCVEDDDDRLVSASIDVFAADRVSGLAVNDGKYLPADATPHEGLVNKWPFDAEQTTYPYWDGLIGSSVDAVYDRTEELEGMEAYVYKVTITDAPIEIAEGIEGTYTDAKEIYVEPRTGAIINQTDDQQRFLEDGTQVLDLQLAFTDDQIKATAAETQDKLDQLTLIMRTVPLIGLIGGGLCVIAGLALFRSARRGREAETA